MKTLSTPQVPSSSFAPDHSIWDFDIPVKAFPKWCVRQSQFSHGEIPTHHYSMYYKCS
jgi:hypothetical protein